MSQHSEPVPRTGRATPGARARRAIRKRGQSGRRWRQRGAGVRVARAPGAGGPAAARLAAKQSLLLGLAVGLLATAVGVALAPQLVAALGAGPDVVRAGAAYLRTFALGGVFIVTAFIAGGVLRGAGDARAPMLVTLGTLALSLLLAVPLTFGGLGLPALGLAGAGLASTLERG